LSTSNANTASTFRPIGLEHRVQALGLRNRAHHAIEDRAARILRLAKLLGDDTKDDRIGHEIATIHERFCLETKACARSNSTSQHVTGGECRQLERRGDERSLRSFSGAGFPEENDDHGCWLLATGCWLSLPANQRARRKPSPFKTTPLG
jgi:hypothetical protein